MALYTEEQHIIPERYHKLVVSAIAVISIGFGVYGASGTDTVSLVTSIGAATIGVFAMLYVMYRLFQVAELGISVSESTVVLKYSPFDSKNIPTDEITSVQTYDEHDYDPGWGVGVKRLSDGAKQYRMYGDAVKINEENGDGILVTTRDPDELASVLERVTSN